VARVSEQRLEATLPAPPDLRTAALVVRDGVTVANPRWLAGNGPGALGYPATWQGVDNRGPHLGDTVVYTVSPQVARRGVDHSPVVVHATAPVLAEDMTAGDAPAMAALRMLAARGLVPGASQRQFAGHGQAVYSRREIASFLVSTLEHLAGWNASREVKEIGPDAAGVLLGVVYDYRSELASLGYDPSAAITTLRRRVGDLQRLGLDWSWTPTLALDGRVGLTGSQAVAGRVRGSLLAASDGRLRTTLTVGSEGAKAVPGGRDRDALDTAHVAFDLSSHLSVGVGRENFRLGAGLHDLLWSERARPTDGFSLTWQTKVLGRPFALEQRLGFSDEGAWKSITLRRWTYSPLRGWTIKGTEALITSRLGQGLASVGLPLYLARFVAGERSRGGYGNMLASFESTYRVNRALAVHGEMMLDDFDFSPKPPRTAQRVGWLAGVHWTPSWALPGSSYRLEGAILPNKGTYIGQADKGMAWMRRGYLYGHEYGDDAFGWRASARQRLTRRLDLDASCEQFRQQRKAAVPRRANRLSVAANYDLLRQLSVSVGYSLDRRRNVGGTLNQDVDDNQFFISAYAGL
jgi:hypothetical protein